MINWFTKALRKLQSDNGENSMMQTITIAVSAILIAAGTITAPGLINGARENTVQIELGNIAFAESAWVAANGFVNENFDPSHPVVQQYPANSDNTGNVPNLASWHYPYSTSYLTANAPQWCYDNQYVISVTSQIGNTYYITSADSKPVTHANLVLPPTCVPGFVPPTDSIPTVPDQINPPTGSATGLAFSGNTEDFLTWTGFPTCDSGDSPAYQVQATISGTTENGAWSSATTQSLAFLNDAQKTTGVETDYVVATECRSDSTGDLSTKSTLSSVFKGFGQGS